MRRIDAMIRVLAWAGVGAASGFIVFSILFYSVAPRNSPEFWLWAVFAAMAAVPTAALAALFGAFLVIKDELEELRSEILRLQEITEAMRRQANPSTQFK
jgi:hypothetical protein